MKKQLLLSTVVAGVLLVGALALGAARQLHQQYVGTSRQPTLRGNTTTRAFTTTDNPFNRQYSQGKCRGSGTVPFTHPPLTLKDIGSIEPYGLMADAHVIPTSHGYVSPTVFDSPPDAYPVYAIADGTIVFVAHRGESIGDRPQRQKPNDYQLYFEHSCTFFSYYDLLTSLAPGLEKQVGKLQGFERRSVRIPVRAGQLVGRIGGKTLDFAVWNFEKTPAFFVNPASYRGDEDRFYLDDLFAHFVEPLRSQLLAKNIRQAAPRTGKVNYDVDGTLAGNWFLEGTDGFRGPPGSQARGGSGRYWDGHLAFAYDFIDPTHLRFSIGNYSGKAAQFALRGNGPDPAMVDMNYGLVTYELQHTEYYDAKTGKLWRREKEQATAPAARAFGPVQGTVLVQLTGPRTLKLEIFPGKTRDEISAFTSAARTYVR